MKFTHEMLFQDMYNELLKEWNCKKLILYVNDVQITEAEMGKKVRDYQNLD